MVGATLLAAAALLGGGSEVAEPAAAAQRCPSRAPERMGVPRWLRPRRATLLVDSVLLGAVPAVRARRPCWRIGVRGRPALMVDDAARQLRAQRRRIAPLVVVGLGYNSLWERDRRNYSKWAARFDRQASVLVRTLRGLGARQIVWVTLRELRPGLVPPGGRDQFARYAWYFPYVNNRLRRLDRRRRDVVIAKWHIAADRPGLTYDAIHTNTTGSRLMSRTIWRRVSREARRQGRSKRGQRNRSSSAARRSGAAPGPSSAVT